MGHTRRAAPLLEPWVGRSVGLQFVTKKGRAIDVLLDADACPSADGRIQSYAALREGHTSSRWKEASTTLSALRHLTSVRRNLERVLFTIGGDISNPDSPEVAQSYRDAVEDPLPTDARGELLELAQNTLVKPARPASGPTAVAGRIVGATARAFAIGQEHRSKSCRHGGLCGRGSRGAPVTILCHHLPTRRVDPSQVAVLTLSWRLNGLVIGPGSDLIDSVAKIRESKGRSHACMDLKDANCLTSYSRGFLSLIGPTRTWASALASWKRRLSRACAPFVNRTW